MPFLEGLLYGLGLAFLIGPVFFTLLQASLKHGVGSGLAVAVGIFASDIVCVVICTLGVATILQDVRNQAYLALGGSVILIGLGLKYVVKPKIKTDVDEKQTVAGYLGYALKGFLVNFVNPFVFFVWIGIIAVGSSKYNLDSSLKYYLAGALVGIFSTDAAKAVLAHKIKRFIKPKILMVLFRVIGICLIGFGGNLIHFGITHLN